MKTKLFVLILAVAASVEFIWASWYQIDGIYYDFNSDTRTASVTYKGEFAGWSEEYLGDIVIPSSVIFDGEIYDVTSIGNGAFADCYSLSSLSIPNSVTTIGDWAFGYCVSLHQISLPKGIISIGNEVFYECTGLSSIIFSNGTPPSISSSTFNNCDNSDFYVPCEAMDIYKETWNAYASRIKYLPLPYDFKLNVKINIIEAGELILPMTICEDTTIIALPNYGYHFYQWSDGTVENPRHIKLEQDTSFIAEFAKNPVITYLYNESMGEIQGDTTLAYNQEGNVTFSAIAKYGYHFVQWSDRITDNPRTIYLTQDTTFTAEFARNTYTISTKSNNSEWGTTIGDTSALYQEQVNISAIANYGYHFDHWSDYEYKSDWEWDYCRSNPRIITVTDDKTYEAVFAKNVYNITKQCDYSLGQVYGPSQARYLDEVSLSAYPAFGYHFTQWSDGVIDNPRTFVITQDTTFTAEFAISTTGQCGENLYWDVSENVLSFSGSGEMYNYTSSSVPWKLFLNDIKEVAFIDGMTSIGNYACANMPNLKQINIPVSVRTIGDYAFANINNRKINKLVLPSNLVSIGAYAFAGNTYIDQIDFGKSLETIGAYAFQNCTRVTTMTCLADITPEVGTDALTSISDYAELYVLSSALRKYQVDENWNRFLLKALGESGELGAYTISYLNKNEELLDSEVVTLHFPQAPEIEGFTFLYWQPVAKEISDGITIQAIYEANDPTSAPAEVVNPKNSAQKLIRDGNVYILTEEKVYTITGQEVR